MGELEDKTVVADTVVTSGGGIIAFMRYFRRAVVNARGSLGIGRAISLKVVKL